MPAASPCAAINIWQDLCVSKYISPVTQRSYMEARGEGFLNLVRESEKLSGKKPLLETIGQAVKLTIYANEPE